MAKVYGFDEYTAREIVRTVRQLQSQVTSLASKSRRAPSSAKPKLMFAKTTLEPGGTCDAYLAKSVGGVVTPNTSRGTYTINDYLYSSFVLGMDDYDSENNEYQEAAILVYGDHKVRTFTPIGENNLILEAKPDTTIGTGGTGTFSVYSGGTDTTYNLSNVSVAWGDNGEGVSANKESWIRYNRFAREWEWIGGDCEV